MKSWRGGEHPRGKNRQPSLLWLKPYLAGAECASRTAELQLCSEARSDRVAGARLLCPGRALPRLASLLGFLPGRRRLREAGRRHWPLPGLSSVPALPLHQDPGVLREGLGDGGLHTAKGSSRESSVRGKERQVQGTSSGCLATKTQRRTECTSFPGPEAGVCSPANPEADSLGAQQLPHTRSFPSALLPSRDVCSWLGPAPACLGSRTQPQLRASSH